MAIDAKMIKDLREETGFGVMDCKRALEEAKGDLNKARALLKQRGDEIVATKSGRVAREGIIASYVHTGGKIGVLVEINCETDFVARNEIFQAFARDICLQVTASNPTYLSRTEVPAAVIEEQKQMVATLSEGKPAAILEKIQAGKLEEFFKSCVLLDQPFVKEPELSIQAYLDQTLARLGEKIAIRRFIRWELGG
ncbi:MAG TPA: translation elongation factor Ts [bacterium]|uniref:Elongation factor Ts n=1 Tax=candidate division TA06 bacterium ADurb.Bin417 TaxID=1852828 RepID=A0A1V5MJ66_UNCT6|nr:MAG: Elongation factor Ts [candidate division TA06 bacterium ADurb.Bin417]HNQ35046.1 translation elongation factor Ts [bacterium]HNS48191.1 translation elongation factor Ts [bacterium]